MYWVGPLFNENAPFFYIHGFIFYEALIWPIYETTEYWMEEKGNSFTIENYGSGISYKCYGHHVSWLPRHNLLSLCASWSHSDYQILWEVLRLAIHLLPNKQKRSQNAKNKKCIVRYFASLFSRFMSLFRFSRRVGIRISWFIFSRHL